MSQARGIQNSDEIKLPMVAPVNGKGSDLRLPDLKHAKRGSEPDDTIELVD